MQYTSYYSSFAIDLNNDQKPDIALGGNYYDCNVQMGRYDADNGSVLLNEGYSFKFQNIHNLPLKSPVKNIKKIQLHDGSEALLFAQNEDNLKLLKLIDN